MSSEQKYPGYEALSLYLEKQNHKKSFWGFLQQHRNALVDAVVATTPAASCWRDLDKSWCDHFLAEAEELLNPSDFNNLEKQVNLERTRRNDKLEKYWSDMIYECELRREISELEKGKERLLKNLREIKEKYK
ncbi:8213_t:CDS:2 [Diversispora eburnea]|uniref:8213_t:CDS:1 n=1 Tax=Diversispora eburnea TaxID=1213867 RepID=A0A9N9BU31_9GLOM|nr:8213_t:CDS:2 [Diversispora eburnea]